jgi:uncharacterized membrane protein
MPLGNLDMLGRLVPDPSATQASGASDNDQVEQNIGAVLDFYALEEQKISSSQRLLERTSLIIGRSFFLGVILLFVTTWILCNIALGAMQVRAFDPPPFFWLQGIVGLGALLTATIVLSKQNRLAGLAEHRAHLDLTVMLLTEQKAAKLIDLLEELRRDLPDVKDRHDSGAAALQQSMSPDRVVAALDEGRQAALRAGSAAAL